MSPENETDLTLLNHYNVFKGRVFQNTASATALNQNIDNNNFDKTSDHLDFNCKNFDHITSLNNQLNFNIGNTNRIDQSAVFSNQSQTKQIHPPNQNEQTSCNSTTLDQFKIQSQLINLKPQQPQYDQNPCTENQAST